MGLDQESVKSTYLETLTIVASCFLILIYSCNKISDSNIENWEVIFNGKDLKDWEIKFANQNLNVNYKNTFLTI